MKKLVRDKIPEIMRQMGKAPVTEIIYDEKAYCEALKLKLLEEINEFLAADNDLHAIEELADIWEVMEALINLHKYSVADIRACKLKKALTRGGFEKKILLIM